MSDNADWWRGAVIYQIYPRSFMDSNGDGIGDLRGIMSKLSYIASLGVDAIWISPFFKSPMKDFGYDISDYRDVDPIFGTIDDFRQLLDEVHKCGLKLLIDQVWSHTSDEHNWFKESRSSKTNARADWYVWTDPKPDGTPPNNWLSIFGGPAWEWDTRREQYYLHHFLSCQPALNLWNPKVREAILDTARYWLDMGVDGFRLDVINCALSHKDLLDNPVRTPDMPQPTDMDSSNPMSRQVRSNAYGYVSDETYKWLNQLRSTASEYGDIFLMGEIGGDNCELLAGQYIDTDQRLQSAYTFGFLGKNLTKNIIVNAVKLTEEVSPDGRMTYAIGNHDNKRFASCHGRFGDDELNHDYAMFGMALLFSMRGSVCVYQGEELGLPAAEIAFKDMQDPYDIRMYPHGMNRDSARTPMPWLKYGHNAGFSNAEKTWLPIPEDHTVLGVDRQETNEESMLNTYRNFLRWRNERKILRYGELDFMDTPDHVVAFKRLYQGRAMLCVFNASSEEQQWTPDTGEHYHLIPEVSHNIAMADKTMIFKRYGYAFFDKIG